MIMVSNKVINKRSPIIVQAIKLDVVSKPINLVNIPMKFGKTPTKKTTKEDKSQNNEYLTGNLFLATSLKIIITNRIDRTTKKSLKLLFIFITFFH